VTPPPAPRTEDPRHGGDATYRELFERSTDAILIIDGGRFVECNEATVRMLRHRTREELLQTHPSELSPEYQPDGQLSYEKANEMMREAFAQGSHRFEWDHKRADGEVFPVEVLLTAVPREDRQILHVVWRDITERKRLENELRQAQKMEAVGKLAGGIAHDFNNLLVAILGHTQLLELDLGERPEMMEHLVEIRRASDRAASLVSQLLAYSRKQVLQPRVIDLDEILDGLEGMLRRLLGEDISVVRCRADEPLRVLMDPGQFEQVVLNLASNARDAMAGGGRLTFETGSTVVSGAEDSAPAQLDPGPYAVLNVSDTGPGIDAEVLDRVFDPFFTTKGPGHGTGLGLATVYGIVRQSGGGTSVESEPGRGACFRIHLPLTAEPLADTEPATVEATVAGGTETILVVEDEQAVLNLVEQVLRSRGYKTIAAGDGAAALTLVESLESEIDLLLTDVIMPHMGGPELARRLRDKRPGLKVVFTSGYTDNSLLQRGVLAESVDLLQKPYAPAELLRRVRAALDATES